MDGHDEADLEQISALMAEDLWPEIGTLPPEQWGEAIAEELAVTLVIMPTVMQKTGLYQLPDGRIIDAGTRPDPAG